MKIRHRSLREDESWFGEERERGTRGPNETDDAPPMFLEEMRELKKWARKNEKKATRDKMGFWLFKLPAILVSASAATLAYYKLDSWATITAGVSSMCVLIDGLVPRGMLYGIHSKAAADIHDLHAKMASQYRQGMLRDEEPRFLAAKILDGSLEERHRINDYVKQAKTKSLREQASPNREE